MSRRLLFFASIVGFSVLTAFSLNQAAFAHVVVKPNEVPTASFQTFTVSVPNEKDIPTTAVKLTIPDNLSHITPTQKTGWNIVADKKNDHAVTITWSGGHIDAGMRDDFSFSAQVPAKPTELQWKAYQTYADGTIVSWDKKTSDQAHNDKNSGPFSVTKIVTTDPQSTIEQSNDDMQSKADRALYIAAGALFVSLLSLFIATRKK